MRFQVSPVLNASRKGSTAIAALAAIGLPLAGAQSAPAATRSYVELKGTTRSGVNAAMVKRPQIVAGTPVAARSEYTIRRTSGISWHAELWVLMYCRKGYTALHGGYTTPPSGLKIESSGPSRAGGLSMWAIEVRNTTGRWLGLHSWATCARG